MGMDPFETKGSANSLNALLFKYPTQGNVDYGNVLNNTCDEISSQVCHVELVNRLVLIRRWSSWSCECHYETSSPPRSMPRPSTLLMCGPSPLGGWRLSKLRRRRASRAAAGVFAPPAMGVRFHDPPTCAGLGVMLRNSAKFRLVDGVARPKPE
jgi:hypothetical protein